MDPSWCSFRMHGPSPTDGTSLIRTSFHVLQLGNLATKGEVLCMQIVGSREASASNEIFRLRSWSEHDGGARRSLCMIGSSSSFLSGLRWRR